jgi:NADH-quinone oxidoreductase subunit N
MGMNLFAAIPEIFVVVMLLIMLLVDAFVSDNKKGINVVLTLVALLGGLFLQLSIYSPGIVQEAFRDYLTLYGGGVGSLIDRTTAYKDVYAGLFVLDALAQGTKLFIYLIGIVIVLYTQRYITDKKLLKGEFYAIFLFAILGMLVMISANNMLILYVGLELLSLALYGLVAIERDSVKATEAAMKFFILGALASGLLLYGISFIYGATGGALQLSTILDVISRDVSLNNPSLVFGLVFLVSGLVFKLGLVPFHMWIPDTYEGSNLATTTIIASITKLAAVVFVIRFLVYGLDTLSSHWSLMLAFVAFFSVFLGNVVAIAQTNIKRMLGYSTVSHMGFVAFGLMTANADGYSSVLFYIITYVVTTVAGFGVLLMLSRDNYECEKIDDLKGLNKSHPIYAGILLLVMFSLAAIPPLVGFYAKFKILQALVSVGYIRSAIFAVIMSVIGAFYYLRVVKVMYFDDADSEIIVANAGMVSRSVLVLNGLLLLILGILPSELMNYCIVLING